MLGLLGRGNKERKLEEFEPWPAPNWDQGCSEALEYLRCHVERQMQGELGWYQRGIRPVRRASRWLRGFAILFTALGGLVPVLSSLDLLGPIATALRVPKPVKIDQFGYLFLALAGSLALFDRFFGFSTGWMRYVTTMLALERRREAFRLEWALLGRRLGTPPDPNVAGRMLDVCKRAIQDVKELTERETEAWVGEFKSSLAQFEKDLRSQLEATRVGGVDVKVADGDQATDGFELALDQMVVERVTGSSGSIAGVVPGLHKISVSAAVQGKRYHASQVIAVPPGGVVGIELTLGLPQPAQPAKGRAVAAPPAGATPAGGGPSP